MNKAPSREDFESILAAAFRASGWKVNLHPVAGARAADMVAHLGKRKYAVEIKSASEGRKDRMIPLLAQAVLEAQAFSRHSPQSAAPLAVVAAQRVPPSVAASLEQFARDFVPEVAVGIIDAEGFRSFSGPGLDTLNARSSRPRIESLPPQADLFSDLNQWMLKVLLGQRLPPNLIAIPKGPFRNASRLAAAASVSVMSASRFVNQLTQEGFLEHEECLRIVRSEELLERWLAANRKAPRELPVRWILKKDQRQLEKMVRQYAKANRTEPGKPRAGLALFAAADALGFGFVRGVPPHVYVDRLDSGVLQELGLTAEGANHSPDLYLRVPTYREAVFRAMKSHGGLPVSDVVQVWLDASSHPSRGREQAEEIRRRALKPLFENRP